MLESQILNKHSKFIEIADGKLTFNTNMVCDEIGIIQVILSILNYLNFNEINCEFDNNTKKAVANFKIEHGLAKGYTHDVDPIFEKNTLIALDERISAKVYKNIVDIDMQKGIRIDINIDGLNEDDLALKIATEFFHYKSIAKINKLLKKNPTIFKTVDCIINSQKSIWKNIFDRLQLNTSELPMVFSSPNEVWIKIEDYIFAENWFRFN